MTSKKFHKDKLVEKSHFNSTEDWIYYNRAYGTRYYYLNKLAEWERKFINKMFYNPPKEYTKNEKSKIDEIFHKVGLK